MKNGQRSIPFIFFSSNWWLQNGECSILSLTIAHVIVSFRPANNRVEQQALGPCQKRTMWQQGGSVQPETDEHGRAIETLKYERDNLESNRLVRFLGVELPQMKMEEDVLYGWHVCFRCCFSVCCAL